MLFPLGASGFLTRDIPNQTFDNDRDKIEFARKIKAQKADVSSDNSCFVGLATTSDLHKDDMCLSQDATSLNGLKRKCVNDGTLGDNNNKKYCMEMERNKNILSPTNSTSPNKSKFMTLTLDSVKNYKQSVSLPFMIENGMTKPGMITLLGKDGRPWRVSLREEGLGRRLFLCKGWRMFSRANGLTKTGESFTFELVLENGTPMLCLLNKDSTSYDRRLIGECSKASSLNKNKNRFMTLHVDSPGGNKQFVELSFMIENNMAKLGMITLLGKDGARWFVNLRENKGKRLVLSKGWKYFSKANGLTKSGEYFTFELIFQNGTPMLCLLNKDSTSYDRRLIEEFPKAMEASSVDKNKLRFMTLHIDRVCAYRQYVSLPFMKENGMTKPGMITLLGKDGTKWLVNLRDEKFGERLVLSKGWKEFAIANGLINPGESFTFELVSENGTPMLSLLNKDSTNYDRRRLIGECSKTAKHRSGNQIREANNDIVQSKVSSSTTRDQFLTLTLTLENVKDCELVLPSKFMKDNDIKKGGKVTFLGKNQTNWCAYMSLKDGVMAVGYGWKSFCENNGVNIGDSFTLEVVDGEDANIVFKFSA